MDPKGYGKRLHVASSLIKNMYTSLMYMYSLTRSLPDLFTINSLVFPLAAQPIFKLHLRVEVQSSPFFLLPSCVWSPHVGSPSLKYEKRPYTSGDEKGRIILKPWRCATKIPPMRPGGIFEGDATLLLGDNKPHLSPSNGRQQKTHFEGEWQQKRPV